MRETDKPGIRRLPLFRDMAEATFARLMQVAYVQTFPPQLDLFTQGERADFLHIIVEGAVELHAESQGRPTVMGLVRPVSAFILAACVRDDPYLMSARTVEKSYIVMLPRADLRAAMRSDADFALAAMAELALGYRVMVRHAKNLKLRSARERLAAWILRQSLGAGGVPSFILPVEKRLLASWLGIRAESLSRTARSLREDGVMIDGARVTITDMARLERLVQLDPLLDGPEMTTATVPVASPPVAAHRRQSDSRPSDR